MKHMRNELVVENKGHKVIEWVVREQASKAFGAKQTLCQMLTFESLVCFLFMLGVI